VVAKPAPVGQNGITVISPNGGETFQVGGSIDVRWDADTANLIAAKVLVDCGTGDWFSLTGNGQVPYETWGATFPLSDTVYSSVQRKNIAFPAGTNCKIKVQDYQMNSAFDTSDAVFTIKAK
jgi:hypothetical protein